MLRIIFYAYVTVAQMLQIVAIAWGFHEIQEDVAMLLYVFCLPLGLISVLAERIGVKDSVNHWLNFERKVIWFFFGNPIEGLVEKNN